MTPVVIDGVMRNDVEVLPTTHKFIGSFRPPDPPSGGGGDFILCPCGQGLWTVEQTREHWVKGHFDTLQYETWKVQS